MSDPSTPAPSPSSLPLWMDVLGWYGSAAIVGAYLASSHGWLEQGLLYQLLNISGASCVGLVCWQRRAWQPLALEIVWVLVGLSALVQLLGS